MSTLRSDNIVARDGSNSPTFPKGAVVTGVVTATSFSGDISGNSITSGTINSDRIPTLNQNTTGTAGNLSGTPNITVGSVTGTTGTFSGNVSVGGTLTYEDVKNIDSVGIITARTSIKLDADGSASSNFLSIGADDDLKIFHQSGVDKIQSSGGGLHIRQINNGDLHIHAGVNDGASNNRLVARAGGKAELYYGGNLKLSTETGGVNITGVCTATSFEDSKGSLRTIPRLDKSSAYTITAADAGKCITADGDITIPNSVMSEGDAVTIIADGTGNITITQAAGLTMYNASDASTGNRTLALRGMANIWFKHTSYCYISGAGLS